MQSKAEEMKAILTDFDEPGHLAPTGLFLGGTKYMVIQGEAGAVIRGKKVLYITFQPNPYNIHKGNLISGKLQSQTQNIVLIRLYRCF